MMQPTFLPWQGMFELILNADRFIFLDDFQYCSRSHHTRNRLFVAKETVGFYGVNINNPKTQEIALNQVTLQSNGKWKNDLLKRMQFVYSKTPYFFKYYPRIESWLLEDSTSLAELNINGVKTLCSILNIEKDFLYSSDFTKEIGNPSVRTQRIVDLLEWSKADLYVSANGSFEYMHADNYDYIKHPVLFQNYEPANYKQKHSREFVPYLSVLDALYNIGADATYDIIKNGTKKWLSFEEMLKLRNKT